MTTIEKLQADMLYNEQHPLFAPYNDEVMGERFTGRYERLGEDEEGVYKRWYFDNGHNYTLVENTNMLYECEPTPEDYFIHKHIEKCIYDIVTSHSDVDMPEIVCTENEVLSMRNTVVLIRTIIDRENRNVAITNIHVQREHWYNGYGKQLIKDIYTVCKNLGFRLLLTGIMPTLYRQMVRRGAKIVEVENIVEITGETNLSYRNIGMIKYIADKEHYTKVLALCEKVKHDLWIGTADLKDLYVEGDQDVVPFLSVLDNLLKQGVDVRLLHAKEPGENFRADFDKYPGLWSRLERRLCPRVHFKIMIFDCATAYIGSANLTGAGMGMKGDNNRNFEAGILTDEPLLVDAAADQLDSVWQGRRCTKCKRKAFCGDRISK